MSNDKKDFDQYFHLFTWPGATFETPEVSTRVTGAYLLSDRKPLTFTQTDGRVAVTLPAHAPDALASLLCLEIETR